MINTEIKNTSLLLFCLSFVARNNTVEIISLISADIAKGYEKKVKYKQLWMRSKG